MKTYTQLLSTLLILLLVVGCYPKREMIPNLQERMDNFFILGNPILVNGNPFTGITFTKFSNGRVQYELEIKKGIPNGQYVGYYENGQLFLKGTYKDGKQNGFWEYHYENGQLNGKGTFKDGNKEGLWEWYNEDGSLWFKTTH